MRQLVLGIAWRKQATATPAESNENGGHHLKLTRHNGRAGQKGVYNPKHNDRQFDLANADHIDSEKAKQNVFWDCYRGYTSLHETELSFEEIEKRYYQEHYGMAVINQNARNEKNRHPERNRSTDDLLKSEKTCPEETIYQIGTMAQSVSSEVLEKIVTDFMAQMKAQFGSHVHVLNWALHLDESTPHIHERHVFDCENRYGDPFPQQEKALEAMGIPLPDPSKPKGKNNNRKMTFDARCRSMLFNIAQSYGLPLDQEAVYGGRCYLEKQDYILAKQQNELQELTLKVADTQTLIKEVSTIAYQEAVEVVADKVRIDTQQEYLQIIAKYQRWMASPERNMPQPLRQTICKCLDVVMKKITKATSRTNQTKKQLLEESTKQHGIAQVQRKAKESVLARLAKRTKPVKNQSDPKPVAWKEQR